jgi:VanZ family protein
VVSWMVVIFVLSSFSDSDLSGGHQLHMGVYKLAHLTEFGILGVVVSGAVGRMDISRGAWWAWVLVVLYAISDEIHQSFVPGRTPLVTDVAIDSIGGLLGMFAYAIRRNIREGRGWSLALLLGRRRPPAAPEPFAGESSLDKAG